MLSLNNRMFLHEAVKELQARPNVFIKDREKLELALINIVEDGKDTVHIIADFDMTLTKYYRGEQRNYTSHLILHNTDLVSQEFKDNMMHLYHKYYPYEIDSTLSYEEKYKKMEEWWHLVHEVYVKEELNQDKIDRSIELIRPVYRENIDFFFNLAEEMNLPLLVFSAGLADIIEALLKFEQYQRKNVHVISNKMVFSGQKPYNCVKFQEPVIHLMNKGEVALKDTPFYLDAKTRSNAILLGDSLSDVNMAKGLTHSNLIKIGFLNFDKDKNLESYMENFDVVLTEDAPLDWVNDLLKLMK